MRQASSRLNLWTLNTRCHLIILTASLATTAQSIAIQNDKLHFKTQRVLPHGDIMPSSPYRLNVSAL